MYAICNVVYGWDLSKTWETPDYNHELETYLEQDAPDGEGLMEEYLEETSDCFLRYYSGGSDYEPMAFGVAICEFDETENKPVSELKLVPSEEDKKTLEEALQKVPEDFKKLLTGEPQAFLMWSSS